MNEKITLILSVIAILLSIFNTYIAFFYKRNSLVGNILKVIIPKKDESEPAFIFFECSLGNTGNRELLVKSIEAHTEKRKKGDTAIEIESKELPCVLKPGEIKLVKFKISYLYAETLCSLNSDLALVFHITASNGRFYTAIKVLKFNETKYGLSLKEFWKIPFIIISFGSKPTETFIKLFNNK